MHPLFQDCQGHSAGRKAARAYVMQFLRAMLLQKNAIKDGNLLGSIAWSRAHMKVIDVWLKKHAESDAKSVAQRAWLSGSIASQATTHISGITGAHPPLHKHSQQIDNKLH